MSRCIKTGGVLRLPREEDQYELGCEVLHGDFHLIGNAVLTYYPRPVKGSVLLQTHGQLVLPSLAQYFQRNTQPYHVLVVPATCITWDKGALHPLDRILFQEALS